MKYSEYLTNLGTEIIEKNPEFELLKEFGINIGYVTSDEEKKSHGRVTFGKCTIIKGEMNKFFIPHDVLITVYQHNCYYFSEAQYKILLEHELKHIHAEQDEETGEVALRIKGHEVEDFLDIISKYGYNWSAQENNQMTWSDILSDDAEAAATGAE